MNPKWDHRDVKGLKIRIINKIGLKGTLRKGNPCGIYLNVLFAHAYYRTNYMCLMFNLLKESMRF